MFLGRFCAKASEFESKHARQVACPATNESTDTKSPALRAISIALFCIVAGCGKPQEAYLTVQMCVSNEQGVMQLKNIMRNVADTEHLQFIDNSGKQVRDIKALDADKSLNASANSIIDIHIEGPDGLGVTAGNLGLPNYQVALGFTEGADAAKAHRLSDLLVQALSQRWNIETVPHGQGVFPMKSCRGQSGSGVPFE